MNRADLEALSREQLIELVLGLAQRVAELEAKLGLPPKTPENSSLPPSHGRKPPGGRKRKGRRKSRPGVARALDPNPTQVREVRAACCPHCRGALAAAAQAPREVYDHVEIPPIRPEVTRVTLMGGTCPHCARAFKAAPPADMAPGSPFGERLRALALHLRFSQDIGFDRLAAVLRDVFGVRDQPRRARQPRPRRRGPLRGAGGAAARAAAGEPGARLRRDRAAGGGENCWLWVMHHGDSAVFRADAEPGQAGARGLPRRAPARLLDLRPLRRAEGLREPAATSSAWRI